MTENDRKLLIGLDQNDLNTIALVNAIEARPIPAIKKPLGERKISADKQAGNINGYSMKEQIIYQRMLEKDPWRS